MKSPATTLATAAGGETIVFDTASMWDKAEAQLLGLARLEADSDGYGAAAVPVERIISAHHLLHTLRARKVSAPQDVYPLPDGNIILEWQYPDGIIQRIEVEGMGTGQLMTSFPNSRANFWDCKWSVHGHSPWHKQEQVRRVSSEEEAAGARTTWLSEETAKPSRRRRRGCSGLESYQLAA